MGSKEHILQSLQQKETKRPHEGLASMQSLSAAGLGAACDREASPALAPTGVPRPPDKTHQIYTLPRDRAAGRSSSRQLQLQTEDKYRESEERCLSSVTARLPHHRTRPFTTRVLQEPRDVLSSFIPYSAWHYNHLVLNNYLLNERMKPFIVPRHNAEDFQELERDSPLETRVSLFIWPNCRANKRFFLKKF